MKEMLITDQEEKISDLEIQDREVFDTLRKLAPHRLEKIWRLYGSRGLIPPGRKNKEEQGKFNPDYPPCIFPVKVDPSKPWDALIDGQYVNVERCNHRVPKGYKGKEAQAIAEIHCKREHLDWYVETHSIQEDGKTRPPRNTKIEVPMWVESKDEDPYLSERERRVMRMENRLAEERISDEEIAEAVNKERDEMKSKRRGRPPKEE